MPTATGETPPEKSPERSPERSPEKSYGNMSEHHWSRTRGERNKEAIDYYRERSHAPGVAAGGAARNFYCMACDGVVSHDQEGEVCPHCGAAIDERTRRYFNWVEIDEPGRGDMRAVLPFLVAALAVLGVLAWLLGSWLLG